MLLVILASVPCVGSTGDLDIHGFLQSPLNNPAWCLPLVLEPGFMLGCVPLGSVSGLHPDEEMLLLWVRGITAKLFHLLFFLSFRDRKGLLESCLQPVAWYRWQMELFGRLVALNSVKVTFSYRYPDVRLYSSSPRWKYGTQSCWSVFS